MNQLSRPVSENGRAKTLTDCYIGTYDSENSRGVYHFLFDTESGRMTEPELFYEARNAKWVSLNGRQMAFPIERQGRAGTCFLELRDGKPGVAWEILEEEQTPCYILQKGAYVYTANYHGGTVMIYRLEHGKPSLIKRIENGTGAGCHQILTHRELLMVPCLEQNRIRLFDLAHDFAPAGEILFPDGSGPRHGIFNREHTKLYVVSEWSNELFSFRVHGNDFIQEKVISVLPKDRGEKPAAAAIRITRDERFLYVSVRGADILTVFALEDSGPAVIQHISCGGAHPRDFILSGNENFLIAANRFEGGIVCFERDKNTGLLKNTGRHIEMPEGVSLMFGDSGGI